MEFQNMSNLSEVEKPEVGLEVTSAIGTTAPSL